MHAKAMSKHLYILPCRLQVYVICVYVNPALYCSTVHILYGVIQIYYLSMSHRCEDNRIINFRELL